MNKGDFINSSTMWIIVVIGVFLIFILTPKIILFQVNIFSFIIYFLCMIIFLLIFSYSLKANKEAILSVNKISKIIKNGIYSKIRHPVYIGDIILMIGIFFLFPILSFLLSLFWMIFFIFFWMNLEERLLIKKFGKEYVLYKKEVPMILPKINSIYK